MQLIVDLTGHGDFSSLQSAIDAIPSANTEETTICIRAGVYREKVVINKSHIRIIGDSAENTVLTWNSCAKDKDADGRDKGTFLSATLLVTGDNVIIEQMTIRNDAGDGSIVGQAVAVYAAGDRGLWRDCRFIAHQDTLFCGPTMPKLQAEYAPHVILQGVDSVGDCPPVPGRQYFENCYIQGDVDFIFGPYRCWFENCTLFMNARGGWYTAANTPESSPFGLVFHRCLLTGECAPGLASLGRPWRAFARTVFLQCEMDEHVDPQGFRDWDDVRIITDRCGEYGTTGTRADQNTRHPSQKRLTAEEAAAITMDAVLDGWKATLS